MSVAGEAVPERSVVDAVVRAAWASVTPAQRLAWGGQGILKVPAASAEMPAREMGRGRAARSVAQQAECRGRWRGNFTCGFICLGYPRRSFIS